MTLYMLAEPQEQILKKVYSGNFQKPQVNYLFDGIDVALPKELSPVLVHDTSVNKQIYQQIIEKNAGLLITSQYPQEQLLAHLRHILIINFKPEQLGVFRYNDPYISSYFFPNLNEQEKLNWLGPIETIEWFNIDWRNRVKQQDKWQTCHNPLAKDWQYHPEKLKTKPVLSKNQYLALQDMQEEKFAYDWQQNPRMNLNEIDIDQTIYWVKQGIKEGFTKKQILNQYLTIRANYPSSRLPESWPSEVTEERMIYLENYLKNTAI